MEYCYEPEMEEVVLFSPNSLGGLVLFWHDPWFLSSQHAEIYIYFYSSIMWQAYRASMLKAFKKTLEEGIFTFIIGMKL